MSVVARPSYARAAASERETRTTAKPLFIKESDFFDSKPSKDEWILHSELYKEISKHVPAGSISGLQRVRGLWRIYMEDFETRNALLTSDFALRGKSLTIYSQNPGSNFSENSVRVRIKNIPLSADDCQITRALEVRNCRISSFFREKLRIDGRLTNCENGDRIAIIETPESPLPTKLTIGRYTASIYHKGQRDERIICKNA